MFAIIRRAWELLRGDLRANPVDVAVVDRHTLEMLHDIRWMLEIVLSGWDEQWSDAIEMKSDNQKLRHSLRATKELLLRVNKLRNDAGLESYQCPSIHDLDFWMRHEIPLKVNPDETANNY